MWRWLLFLVVLAAGLYSLWLTWLLLEALNRLLHDFAP